jgi:LysM repeat protein
LVGLSLVGCREPQPPQPQPPVVVTTPTAATAVAVLPDETVAAMLTAEALTAQPLATHTPLPSATPAPPSCGPPDDWVLYVVRPGDTLFSLANRTDTTVADIKDANCMVNDIIYVGDELYLSSVPPSPPSQPPPAPVIATATAIPPTEVVPTDEPTIPDDLLEEIFFDLGGEPSRPRCPVPPQGTPQDIKLSNRVKDFFELCVYGFPLGETVTVELSQQQDESFVVAEEYVVEDEHIFEDGERITVIKTFLWAPVGLASGWTVSASSASLNLETDITFAPFTVRATNTMPADEINPFVFQWCGFHTYQPDDVVIVKGTNFDPNMDVSVGLYGESEAGPFPLVRGRSVKTDDQGDFVTEFTVLPSDPSGKVWVIPMTDNTITTYREVDQDVQCFEIP